RSICTQRWQQLPLEFEGGRVKRNLWGNPVDKVGVAIHILFRMLEGEKVELFYHLLATLPTALKIVSTIYGALVSPQQLLQPLSSFSRLLPGVEHRLNIPKRAPVVVALDHCIDEVLAVIETEVILVIAQESDGFVLLLSPKPTSKPLQFGLNNQIEVLRAGENAGNQS